MVCKMVKRGVLGATLGAGALALLFGTAAPSYVKTAFTNIRQSAKEAVPPQFEIDRARQELAALDPAIEKCTEKVARAEYQVDKLQSEIVADKEALGLEAKALVAKRAELGKGDVQRTGSVSPELKAELAWQLDHYRDGRRALSEKEGTLKQRRQGVQAAREQLDNMKKARLTLQAKIEAIEAKLRKVEAKQAASHETFDDGGALDRVKKTVAEIEERVDVMDRVVSHHQRYSDKARPAAVEANRNVLQEIDTEFATPSKDTTTADKNL